MNVLKLTRFWQSIHNAHDLTGRTIALEGFSLTNYNHLQSKFNHNYLYFLYYFHYLL